MPDPLAELHRAAKNLRGAVHAGVSYAKRQRGPSLALDDPEDHQALLAVVADVLETLAVTCDYAGIRANEKGMSQVAELYANASGVLGSHALKLSGSDTVAAARPRRPWKR